MRRIVLIILIALIVLILTGTVMKYKEDFYGVTYVNTPQVTGVFPTYSGSWYDGIGLPYIYPYPRGFAPYRYPYRWRYPYRRRYPYRPRYPWRYPRYLEGFGTEDNSIEKFGVQENFGGKTEGFVGADDERNNLCVTNQCRAFSGYPEHGFEKTCQLKFPRDNPGKLPTKLDIPMITATTNAKNYEIGRWVHFGRGYAPDQIVDVYQFNIEPSRDLYRYAVKTNCGETYNVNFDINVYGLEDGYRFYVESLGKTFLLRKDSEFLYAWR